MKFVTLLQHHSMESLQNSKCVLCKARLKSIFSDLSAEEMQQLEDIKSCQVVKKGKLLFNEGAYPRGLYCVQTGKIKISQTGIDGKEQIVHMLNNGDIMGHRAIFGEDKYSCSAIALEDSHVCFLPKTPFYKMVENNSKLALKIAHLLSEELKEAERKITSTAQLPVLTRVAMNLLILKDNYGLEVDESTINIVIKREDFARIVGTTRETVTRVLYDLQNQKVIELVGKKIKILDLQKLQSLSNS